ncbi:hypothetical protein [Saccharophagus degradans]|uniref:S1 motif domain-containing protein n=1 Tax=Saccharophagus degradans (strain 2-40 / ATCC 43961 / DSM 17024) TaxID=203122 RepID=Q21NN5_SACD2|nr:hypothetical protein [Saccharophagus degradans]ABD79694.1 hypothetical protein Sde_0430 [Saccharophagus degradans 2-40]
MNQDKVLATIKSKFDLGYIVVLESGEEAQLRVLEQKGRELEFHIAGTEEKLYGQQILVYITYRDERYCSVSQFSPAEREEREGLEKKKKYARETCKVGGRHIVEIENDYEWGYLCSEVSGFLSGAIKKPAPLLVVGQVIEAVIIGKNKNGAPYMEVYNSSNA